MMLNFTSQLRLKRWWCSIAIEMTTGCSSLVMEKQVEAVRRSVSVFVNHPIQRYSTFNSDWDHIPLYWTGSYFENPPGFTTPTLEVGGDCGQESLCTVPSCVPVMTTLGWELYSQVTHALITSCFDCGNVLYVGLTVKSIWNLDLV